VGERKRIEKRLDKASRHFYQREPESVAVAAKRFGLDSKDARQREKLLWVLADVVFGRGKRGRPKGSKTSWGRRLFILGEIYQQKKNENPKPSDAKIAKLIKNEHAEFKNDDAEQIRQRLRMAHQEFYFWCLDRAADYEDEQPDGWEPPEPDYDDYRD